MRRKFLRIACACVAASALPALGATYPERPVRIVVPFPAGGGTDAIARSLGEELSRRLGKPFIVENKPGAASIMGSDQVSKSPADGYTLLLTTSAFAIVESVGPKLPYDGTRAFEPIALLGRAPNVVLVRKDSRLKSMQDLLQVARASPGKVTYGSAGNGSSVHLAAEYLQAMSGIRLTHVPYKGSAPQFSDLLAGHIDAAFAIMASSASLIRDGRLRALAVTSADRSPTFPEVPTVSEVGVKGYSADVWYGVFAPKGTSSAIVQTLYQAIANASTSGPYRDRLAREGVTGKVGSPQQLTITVDQEVARWKSVAKERNIQFD